MPTFSSLMKIAGFIDGLLPVIGTRLIDSVPPAIITSASPTRMRSAAICTAVSPEAQKRFTVTPPTECGRPASSAPMRATFMPCSASGIAQPTIASSIAFGSSVRHLFQRAVDRRDEQVVGARVLEVPTPGSADRRAGRGNDVGVLNLLACHVSSPWLRSGARCDAAKPPPRIRLCRPAAPPRGGGAEGASGVVQFRTGLPVCNMPMMRSWVFG